MPGAAWSAGPQHPLAAALQGASQTAATWQDVTDKGRLADAGVSRAEAQTNAANAGAALTGERIELAKIEQQALQQDMEFRAQEAFRIETERLEDEAAKDAGLDSARMRAWLQLQEDMIRGAQATENLQNQAAFASRMNQRHAALMNAGATEDQILGFMDAWGQEDHLLEGKQKAEELHEKVRAARGMGLEAFDDGLIDSTLEQVGEWLATDGAGGTSPWDGLSAFELELDRAGDLQERSDAAGAFGDKHRAAALAHGATAVSKMNALMRGIVAGDDPELAEDEILTILNFDSIERIRRRERERADLMASIKMWSEQSGESLADPDGIKNFQAFHARVQAMLGEPPKSQGPTEEEIQTARAWAAAYPDATKEELLEMSKAGPPPGPAAQPAPLPESGGSYSPVRGAPGTPKPGGDDASAPKKAPAAGHTEDAGGLQAKAREIREQGGSEEEVEKVIQKAPLKERREALTELLSRQIPIAYPTLEGPETVGAPSPATLLEGLIGDLESRRVTKWLAKMLAYTEFNVKGQVKAAGKAVKATGKAGAGVPRGASH